MKDELAQLRLENARLKTLLKQHDISWEKSTSREEPTPIIPKKDPSSLTPKEKVTLFRNLFRGRSDVYAARWESRNGKSGYSPACGNEWKPGICNKPRVKCANCAHRLLMPVTEQVIYKHLTGRHIVGIYPLLPNGSCYFLAIDFDKTGWRENARAIVHSCHELKIPAALEISRSGNGAHVWIFFSEPVPAHEARELGSALISYTCNRTRQISLSSYDRLFPNQDTLPKGGFGNLIALPLQKRPRRRGFSVFIDDNDVPYPDQWAFLQSTQRISRNDLENAILLAADGRHPIDVAFVSEEDENKPWQQKTPPSNKLSGPLPASLKLVLADRIYIGKGNLTPALTNRLIRLAAFQNPEFYKAQAMRLSVWNKPRIIGCAENFPQHIALPRGCLNAVQNLLKENNIQIEIQEERTLGNAVAVKFVGELRKEQEIALKSMLNQETGVLCAPTAFGKTVIAAALIARRKTSTLILVHRTELLRQWNEKLTTFLKLPENVPGLLGGGKRKLTGEIDITLMQSLSRRKDLQELLSKYGQIIVDECHHVSAFSFETIVKQAKAKFVVGLTATPVRRDGHHPIIFMQCGPIQHNIQHSQTTPVYLEVRLGALQAPVISPDSGIQDIFRALIKDAHRNMRIARDILTAYQEKRKILVLTERTEHLELLRKAIGNEIEHCFVLHGRLPKKQRTKILAKLAELKDSSPRVLLATGRLIGEGFDYPPLDTLVLAMPISWKGTLRQYAGRLHREHVEKQDVRIYDYVEPEQPQLARMWEKRRRGYRAMGYLIKSTGTIEVLGREAEW